MDLIAFWRTGGWQGPSPRLYSNAVRLLGSRRCVPAAPASENEGLRSPRPPLVDGAPAPRENCWSPAQRPVLMEALLSLKPGRWPGVVIGFWPEGGGWRRQVACGASWWRRFGGEGGLSPCWGRWFRPLSPQDCADEREGPAGRRQAAVSWGRQLEVPPGLGHGVCAQWAWRAAVSGRKRSCPQAGAWTPSARGVSKGLRARVRPGDLRQVPSSEVGPGQRCRARGRDPGPGISRGPCSRGRGGWFVSGGAGPGQGAALCECAFPSQRALGWDVRVGTCTRGHTRSRLPRSLPWTVLGGAWSRVCAVCGDAGADGGTAGTA